MIDPTIVAIYEFYCALASTAKRPLNTSLSNNVPFLTSSFSFIPQAVALSKDSENLAEDAALAYLASAFMSHSGTDIHPLDFSPFPNCWGARLQANPAFTQSVHQYFIKALLLDDKQIDAILAKANLADYPKGLLRAHIKSKLQTLKYALMQVPEFRENVTQFTQKNMSLVDAQKLQKLQTQAERIHRPYPEKADRVAFKKAFNKDFDPLNDFHKYAMQMLIASGNEDFNIQDLLAITKEQAGNLKLQMKKMLDSRASTFAGENHQKLKDVFIAAKRETDPWEQAVILFKADQEVTNDIRNSLVSKAGSEKNEEQEAEKLRIELEEKWRVAKEAVEATLTGIAPLNNGQEIVNLLRQGIAHAEKTYSGNATCAIAYLNKINAVAKIVKAGIEQKRQPAEIAAQMIPEINRADEEDISINKNLFKWLIGGILNFLRGFDVTLSEDSVSIPYFATKRQKQLSDVVQRVVKLPSLRSGG